MSLYLSIRKLVDADLSSGSRRNADGQRERFVPDRAISYFVALLPPFLLGMVTSIVDVGAVAWTISCTISAAAFTFVVWRNWRIFRASALKSARSYERRGRYALPPEYADATSAELDKRRARSKRGNGVFKA